LATKYQTCDHLSAVVQSRDHEAQPDEVITAFSVPFTLTHPRRQNEGSKSTTNLEQTSTGQILDRTTNSDAAHLKSLKQSIFGR
jgi:hypothetical protein